MVMDSGLVALQGKTQKTTIRVNRSIREKAADVAQKNPAIYRV